MKNKSASATFIKYLLILVLPITALAQNNSSTSANYKIGDKVEAEYTTWYQGKIVEVLYNGDQYKVELYPKDGGKSFIYTFPKFRLRPSIAPLPIPAIENGKLKYSK
jgi:hypothetical protein